MTDKNTIETTGLTKVFRDFWGHQRVIAVDRLDLEVGHGEVYGLLGPNGSGKSTTIKMLLGLLFPTRGQARVLGQPPGHVRTNARIGYLPEESHLYPFLNARETLDFYGRLFGLDGAQRRSRIDSLLEMVGLGSVARRPIGEYSKGMARRIGLAQALINDPDLLILDEPTSGLDPIGTRQIKDLIRELGSRGKTVLLCSHLLADAEDVCDRICVLYGGRSQAMGSVDELLSLGDMTEIRVPQLSAATMETVRNVIQQTNDEVDVEFSTPRTSLETFFLETVAHAQATEVQTSGALMGGGVSDFLSAPEEQDEGESVIEELVAGSRQDSVTADEEAGGTRDRLGAGVDTVPIESAQQPRRDVLQSLVETVPVESVADDEGGDSAVELADGVASAEGAGGEPSIDHSVIEGLLDGGDGPRDGQPDKKNNQSDTNGNHADKNDK